MSKSFEHKTDSSGFQEFVRLVRSTRDYDLLEDLLMGITTESERIAIAHRLQIIQKLLDGYTHMEIADNLGVGIATVTRGSRELAHGRFKILRKKK